MNHHKHLLTKVYCLLTRRALRTHDDSQSLISLLKINLSPYQVYSSQHGMEIYITCNHFAHAQFIQLCFKSTGKNMTSTVSWKDTSATPTPLPFSPISAGRHGRISTHLISLITLLRSQLFHHRFTEATPIIETLAAAVDRAPGIVWRVRYCMTFEPYNIYPPKSTSHTCTYGINWKDKFGRFYVYSIQVLIIQRFIQFGGKTL